MMDRFPPWLWVVAVAVGGLGFLMWHDFERHDEDEAWLDPEQPPAMVALPLVPGAHGDGAPMACTPAFRGRCYPDTLQSVLAVLGGD